MAESLPCPSCSTAKTPGTTPSPTNYQGPRDLRHQRHAVPSPRGTHGRRSRKPRSPPWTPSRRAPSCPTSPSSSRPGGRTHPSGRPRHDGPVLRRPANPHPHRAAPRRHRRPSAPAHDETWQTFQAAHQILNEYGETNTADCSPLPRRFARRPTRRGGRPVRALLAARNELDRPAHPLSRRPRRQVHRHPQLPQDPPEPDGHGPPAVARPRHPQVPRVDGRPRWTTVDAHTRGAAARWRPKQARPAVQGQRA